MIYPWVETKVDSSKINSLIEKTISEGYILEIQNPVLSSNNEWGSIFYGKTKILSPQVFSDLVVDTVPNIQSLKTAYEAVYSFGNVDSTNKAYYDVLESRVFKDYPLFEISCCGGESILFPFVSEEMLFDYINSCRYFDFSKAAEDKLTKATSLWYIKTNKDKRFSLLYRPTLDIPKEKIFIRYRIWKDVEAFKKFTKTLGSKEWKSQDGKQYSEVSLLESSKFYSDCYESIEDKDIL